jgi:hypothetical protein
VLPVVGLALAVLLGWRAPAAAQNASSPFGAPPAVSGTNGAAPFHAPMFSGSQDANVRMHMGPTGKPCLSVSGFAEPQILNPRIFTHMISAANDCSQTIKMQVCYYHSEHCTPVEVPGYGRKHATLGIMPEMNEFRFEYREQFDTPGFDGPGSRFN